MIIKLNAFDYGSEKTKEKEKSCTFRVKIVLLVDLIHVSYAFNSVVIVIKKNLRLT